MRSTLVILVGAAALAAQESPPPAPAAPASASAPATSADPWSLAMKGKYLAALAAAERAAANPKRGPEVLDTLAVVRSFVGDGAGAEAAMEELNGVGSEARAAPADLSGVERFDALEKIVELAKDRRIVIVNEAHHVPQHRAFTLALAARLKPLGFTHLACETFASREEAAKLAKSGVPTQSTGFYSLEPTFGELLRQAAKLGYVPIHYEMKPASMDPNADAMARIADRETQQAGHLFEQLFAQDSGAKVLIHVGYSHATEDWRKTPEGRDHAWMAARLARLTGLDPLTIDQTGLREASTFERSPATWRAAVERGMVPRPTLLRRKDGSWLVEGAGWAGGVDLQVLHPRSELVAGRPSWLALDPAAPFARHAVEVPLEIEAKTSRLLAQAFLASEPEDAIPVDQVVLVPGEPAPVLMLPAGAFRLVVQDETGAEVMRLELEE